MNVAEVTQVVVALLQKGCVVAAELLVADALSFMSPQEQDTPEGFRLIRALNWLENNHPKQALEVLSR